MKISVNKLRNLETDGDDWDIRYSNGNDDYYKEVSILHFMPNSRIFASNHAKRSLYGMPEVSLLKE